jgi:hypothetical protein
VPSRASSASQPERGLIRASSRRNPGHSRAPRAAVLAGYNPGGLLSVLADYHGYYTIVFACLRNLKPDSPVGHGRP